MDDRTPAKPILCAFVLGILVGCSHPHRALLINYGETGCQVKFNGDGPSFNVAPHSSSLTDERVINGVVAAEVTDAKTGAVSEIMMDTNATAAHTVNNIVYKEFNKPKIKS